MPGSENGKPAKWLKSTKTKFLILALLLVLSGLGVAVALAIDNPLTDLIVSPDPVKIGSNATIRYTLVQGANVTVNVATETGDIVRTVVDNVYKNAGPVITTWDTTDSAGQLVADGNYNIIVIAKDDGGVELGRLEKLQKAARSPSLTGVSVSPEPFNPASGQNATLSYTLSSDSLVSISVMKGASTVKVLTDSKHVLAGTATEIWDGTNNLGALAADGSYTYQLKAESPTVSTFYTTAKPTVTVECYSPSITGFTVTPNPLKLASTNASIRYTLSENAKVTLKVMDSSNNLVRTLWDSVAKTAGPGSTTWDGKKDDGTYVAEGQYTVVISAVDNYNKPSVEQSATLVAGFKPVTSAAAVSPDPYNNADAPATPANISYTVSNDSFVTVQIMKGTSLIATLEDKKYVLAGSYTSSWNGMSGTSVAGDGSYTLQITTVSPTVSSFSTIYKLPFSVEKGGPVISDVVLVPNPLKLGSNLSIRYILSEESLVTVEVYQGDTVVRTLLEGASKASGYNSLTWDGKDANGSLVAEGTYSVKITAVDLFGNPAVFRGDVTVGNVPAISAVTDTPDPFNPTGGATATINYTLSNESKVTVTILKGSVVVRTLTAGETKAAGSNQITWDGLDDSQPAQRVGDGTYTYKIEAASLVVSTARSSVEGELTVSASAPTITAVTISPATVKIGSNATLRYTLSEAGKVSFKVLDGNGQVISNIPDQDKTSGGSFTMIWDTKDSNGNLIGNGTYTFRLSVVDGSAQTGNAEITFQANCVPQITNVLVNPAPIDLSTGKTTTNISFNISEKSLLTMRLYDSADKLWKTPFAFKEFPAGPVSVTAGVYENGKLVSGPVRYTIDARSVVGNFLATQAVGTFDIIGTLPEKPLPPSAGVCKDCHTDYPLNHPVANCYACHTNDKDDPTITQPKPISDCIKCHDGWTHGGDVLAVKFECDYCHNSSYPAIPSHGDISTLHQTTIATDCAQCHKAALDVEHPLHKDTLGNPYDCTTCHQSTVAGVVYAIANHQKDCSACHSSTNHESSHTPPGLTSDCTACHKDSLTQEHLNNPTTQTDANGNIKPWTCNTCHQSTNQTVTDAVYNKNSSCSACHTGADHESFHITNELDSNCLTCHKNSLTQDHMNNPLTQIRTDPLTGQPVKLTCDTCHKSTNPDVTGAIATDDKQCAACHATAHDVNLVEKVPVDIPLYPAPETTPAIIWSQPLDASFWAGESWMPDEFLVGGKVVMSSRSTDANMTGDKVWAYYSNKLVANGWTVASQAPASGSNFFNVTFTKGTNHKAVVWFYGGSAHNAEPVMTAGYRIEIVYK